LAAFIAFQAAGRVPDPVKETFWISGPGSINLVLLATPFFVSEFNANDV
jgi:hypothetical protein